MKIEIKKLTDQEVVDQKIYDWPVWEKEISHFDWEYNEKETCYIIEGKAKVVTDEETVEFKAGDIVTFPAGLKCRWEIIEPIKKHYFLG